MFGSNVGGEGVCCKDDTSTETAGTAHFCNYALSNANTPNANHIILNVRVSTDYFQAAIAQCPFYKDTCTATKGTSASTLTTISDTTRVVTLG